MERVLSAIALCWLAALLAPPASGAAAVAPPPPTPSAAAFNPRVLGLPQMGGPLTVLAAFQLQDIDEIDDEAETFEFTGVLTLVWNDPRQAFDTAADGVREKVFQGAYQFNELSPAWYPQLILVNQSGPFVSDAVTLRVRPDGTCILVQTINAVAEADLDLRRYPFDQQRLSAVFQILGFDASEVVFAADPTSVVADLESIRVPQWELVSARLATGERPAPHASSHQNAAEFTIGLELTRRPLFILRLVVVPLVLIVLLSWSVFWMERSALADRLSISFIGILTAVAYQIVVSDLLPRISYITFMNAFLNISFWLMCATVVESLVVGGYDKGGQYERGDHLDRTCRWAFPAAYIALVALAAGLTFYAL